MAGLEDFPPMSPPDVLWIKYEGDLPEGAIVCGSANGEPIYAARVHHGDELLLGGVNLKTGKCSFAKDGKVHESTDFEIVAVPVGEPLDWEKVNADTTVSRKNLFYSGVLLNKINIYVARIVHDGNTFVGWADVKTKRAHIPMDGVEKVYEEFDVLIHKFLQFLCICPPCPPPLRPSPFE